MNPTAAPTPISQRNETLLAAKRAQEQREQGIRANAIKQGRELERKEICEKAGVTVLDDISILHQIRVEHAAADQANELRWMREEAKHGKYKWWVGYAFGIATALPATAALILAMQGVIWDTAARNFREQAMTGAVLSAGQEQRQVEQNAVAPTAEPAATLP